MTRRWIWLAAALAAVVVVGGLLATGLRGTGSAADPTTAGPATRIRNAPAPPLTGSTLTGQPFDLAALRGRVVLVNVWASWCDPCRQELPVLVAAGRRWSGSGLRVVGVDVRDNDVQARQLLSQVGGADVPSVVDRTGTAAIGWGVVGVPETFLVDRDGRVRVWAQGPVTAEWLEQRVPPLLRS